MGETRIEALDGLAVGQEVWIFPTFWYEFELAVVSAIGRKNLHVNRILPEGIKKVVLPVGRRHHVVAFSTRVGAIAEKVRRLRRQLDVQRRVLQKTRCKIDQTRKEIALAIAEARKG